MEPKIAYISGISILILGAINLLPDVSDSSYQK
jgi:hypothetical protein